MNSQTVLPSHSVSFEFFPPKGFSAERGLMTCAHALRRFRPAFQTVTLGAGGQSQGLVGQGGVSALSGEEAWPARLLELTSVPTAAHIPLSRFKDESSLFEHLDALWSQRVYRLVLIRGDGERSLPEDYADVAAAVSAIARRWDFDICVSAYPEVHPKAQSLSADLAVLKAKQDAGAARAITQFFFNNEDFYRFREGADKAGVRMPIIPGVIPIYGAARIQRFARMCGATFSDDVAAQFAACDGDRARETDVARRIVEDQVADLARNGVDHIHVYTLNRSDLAADACRAFNRVHEQLPRFRLALAG